MIQDRVLTLISNVTNILTVIQSYQEGSVVFQTGKNAIEIVTRKAPVEVWISLKSSGDMSVCNGDLDRVSYTLTPTGFVLYADVVSESLQVEYCVCF